MSDVDPTPDDLLVSAVLDGEASPAEAERVASDPRLAARLEQLRVVARAVGGPVPLVDPVVREAHLAAALAEARRLGPSSTPVPEAPTPVPAPPTPPPPIDLAAARARRRPVGTVILSVAAAVVLVAAVAAGLSRLATDGSSSGDEAASTATADDTAGSAEAADGGADAAVPDAAGDSSALGEGGQVPSTTAPAPSASTERGIDPTLPDLGTFTKAGDLAAAVRGRLVLDPRPEAAGPGEACQADFPVPTTLLGRATVEGEEGLVYVEAAPGSGRRLWLVDPSTPGAGDDACRQVVPVQTL